MSKARLRLTDRQCRLFLKDMKDFGYTNLTFSEIRKIADAVADGEANESDPVDLMLLRQIDEATSLINSPPSSVQS